jgi:hypothetical protein
MKKTEPTTESQSERFKQAARELGCDDSEERFVETVRKVAKAPPARNEPPKPKRPDGRK